MQFEIQLLTCLPVLCFLLVVLPPGCRETWLWPEDEGGVC